jgi:phosphatidylinositol-3-phosphatase
MRRQACSAGIVLLLPCLTLAAEPTGDGTSAYFGTIRSGAAQGQPGSGPAAAYSSARAHGLDFLIYADRDPLCGGPGREALEQGDREAAQATRPGRFVAIHGADWGPAEHRATLLEPSLSFGSANCGGRSHDVRLTSASDAGPGGLYEAMAAHPGLWGPLFGSFAAGSDSLRSGLYGKDVMRLTEMAESADGRGAFLDTRYLSLLSQGWRVGVLQRNEAPGPDWAEASQARTGVLSRSLTKSDLMEALQARRTFVTPSSTAWLSFKAGAHFMGEELTADGPLQLSVRTGDVEQDSFVRTVVYAGRLPADDPEAGAAEPRDPVLPAHKVAESPSGDLEALLPPPPQDSYYYAVAEQADGKCLVSSPLFVLAESATSTPRIKHVFVIAMENTDASQIYGNTAQAPYINGTLIPSYAKASNFADELPSLVSEPHYVWMEAGTNAFSDHTFTTDNNPSSTNSTNSTDHLATQITNAPNGVTWMSYQEDINSTTGACPIAGSGFYAPKHDPFVFFQDVSGSPPSKTNAYCSAHHKPYSSLASDLTNHTVASYNFITPNLCNDMHGAVGCPNSDTIRSGDDWLAANLPALISYANANQGVIFITWDEGSGTTAVPFLVVGPGVKANFTSSVLYNHSSMIESVEEILQLPILPAVAGSNDFGDFFTAGNFP